MLCKEVPGPRALSSAVQNCMWLLFILGVNSRHKPDALSTAVSHHGPGVFRLRYELVVSIVQSGFLLRRGFLTHERWPFVGKNRDIHQL